MNFNEETGWASAGNLIGNKLRCGWKPSDAETDKNTCNEVACKFHLSNLFFFFFNFFKKLEVNVNNRFLGYSFRNSILEATCMQPSIKMYSGIDTEKKYSSNYISTREDIIGVGKCCNMVRQAFGFCTVENIEIKHSILIFILHIWIYVKHMDDILLLHLIKFIRFR